MEHCDKESPKKVAKKVAKPSKKRPSDDSDQQATKPAKRTKKEGPYTKYNIEKQAIPFGKLPRVSKGKGAFRCISWNVAGLRALLTSRADELRSLLAEETPDLLFLLETKIQKSHEADMQKELATLAPKYTVHFHSCDTKKGYSGICVLSLDAATVTPMPGDDEGRAICVRVANHPPVCGSYTPNSGDGLPRLDYRIDDWDVKFRKWVSQQGACVMGDLNAAHLDLDIWNAEAPHIPKSAGTTPRERESFSTLLEECQLVDSLRHFSPDVEGVFTYWSVRAGNITKNRGLRLDYGLVPRKLLPQLAEGFTLVKFAPKGDHCPVGFTLNAK